MVRTLINLTPVVPLSFKGEGQGIRPFNCPARGLIFDYSASGIGFWLETSKTRRFKDLARLGTPKLPEKIAPRGLDKLWGGCYICCMAEKQGATVRLSDDDFLSVGKAAKVLGTSRWSIYRWIEAGKIVGIKLGGILFIPKSEIERLNKKATGGTSGL